MEELKGQTKTNRVNFFSEDLKNSVGRFSEPFSDTYSWYLYVYSPESLGAGPTAPIALDLVVERVPHFKIEEVDRHKIRALWECQYVEEIQGNRTREQKMDLLASIETTLSEGTHLLYRKHGRLIGHGAFVEDINEVLDLSNLYVHLWIHQSEPVENRRMILSHYFSTLRAEKRSLVAGIAVNNVKSLRVFSSNGFEPVLLSMGVYK